MWARIEHNVVMELTDQDPSGRFSPELKWVEVPENVQQGWKFNGVVFAENSDDLANALTSPKDYIKFRRLAYENPEFVEAKQTDSRFVELVVWVVNKDFTIARQLWRELKSAGRISPALESSFATMASECGITDDFLFVVS